MSTDSNSRQIRFSPPDISQAEIDAVVGVLQSEWITTGPATKELERRLRDFTGAAGVVCVNSATAALELILRLLGIGPGDEVIAPAYTYTASVSPIVHVGATPVLVDVAPGTYRMDLDALAAAITPNTRAVIPVDIGGRMEDYAGIFGVLESKRSLWQPQNTLQATFDRVIVVADAAHSLGAEQGGRTSGSVADFSSFSFHAVKNLTTAEGGALAWRDCGVDSDALYHQAMLLALHGQSKDALAKEKLGGWEYDIEFLGYKYNMTDIAAALGLAQLDRYPQLLARRRELIERYERNLAALPVLVREHYDERGSSSGHLMLTRVEGATESVRNAIIEAMAARGVPCNVHYKPLPLMSAYVARGFSIADYPNAYAQYANEITLPLHTLLTDSDVDFICEAFGACIRECC